MIARARTNVAIVDIFDIENNQFSVFSYVNFSPFLTCVPRLSASEQLNAFHIKSKAIKRNLCELSFRVTVSILFAFQFFPIFSIRQCKMIVLLLRSLYSIMMCLCVTSWFCTNVRFPFFLTPEYGVSTWILCDTQSLCLQLSIMCTQSRHWCNEVSLIN